MLIISWLQDSILDKSIIRIRSTRATPGTKTDAFHDPPEQGAHTLQKHVFCKMGDDCMSVHHITFSFAIHACGRFWISFRWLAAMYTRRTGARRRCTSVSLRAAIVITFMHTHLVDASNAFRRPNDKFSGSSQVHCITGFHKRIIETPGITLKYYSSYHGLCGPVIERTPRSRAPCFDVPMHRQDRQLRSWTLATTALPLVNLGR